MVEQDEVWRDFFQTELMTGLRRGEICGLQWSDFDGNTGTLKVCRSMTDFKPYIGRKRRSATGCVTEINDHLFEGRYSPKWPDGKKHARNVYAHTREECEEKLKVLIVEMKAEIAEAKWLKDLGEGDGRPTEGKEAKRTKNG